MNAASVGRWGPEQRQAAVSLTIDHLGEACEISLGELPRDTPTGNHFTATRVLPAVLNVLNEHGVSATFFLEGWNAYHYPAAMRCVVERGHELGSHGFLHEGWGTLGPEEERETFHKITEAHAKLGTPLHGFRASGAGAAGRPSLTSDSLRLLEENGFRYLSTPTADPGYLSPPGGRAHIEGALGVIPYSWYAVDTNYYFPDRARGRGMTDLGEGPDALVQGFLRVVDQTVQAGESTALYLHLTSLDTDDRLQALATLAAKLKADDRVWLARCDEIADWMFEHPDLFH